MEIFCMSRKEMDRVFILRKIIEKKLTHVEAAEFLGITDRQVRNLLKEVKIGENPS